MGTPKWMNKLTLNEQAVTIIYNEQQKSNISYTHKTIFPKLKHKNEKCGNIVNVDNLRKTRLLECFFIFYDFHLKNKICMNYTVQNVLQYCNSIRKAVKGLSLTWISTLYYTVWAQFVSIIVRKLHCESVLVGWTICQVRLNISVVLPTHEGYKLFTITRSQNWSCQLFWGRYYRWN